ncbi:hypothetical protein GCM10008022_30380 [Paenibacillus hunanensis]|nr:hypothetical protein GCM10008022_30380 [Paenibacillus hunanensis]
MSIYRWYVAEDNGVVGDYGTGRYTTINDRGFYGNAGLLAEEMNVRNQMNISNQRIELKDERRVEHE